MSKICRLCLQTGSESYYNMVTDDYRHKMRSVIPEINIDIVEEPFICEKCSDLLSSAYSFKSNCLQTEEDFKTYTKVDGKQLRLEEFLRQKNEDLLSRQMETVESCAQDVSSDEDSSNVAKVICDNLAQKANNLNQEANLEDTHEIEVGETLRENNNENIPTDAKAAENVTARQNKSRIAVHKCPICDKIFLQKRFFEAHLRNHNRDKLAISKTKTKTGKYKCHICNLILHWKTTFETHMRVHTGERPYCCTDCGKSFAQSSTLDTHVRSVHMLERPYICEICGMRFPILAAYTAHRKRRHEPVEKKFVCSFCGKGFRIKSMLEMHVRWHTGERPCSCQVCGKRFVSQGSVTRHMRIHNGVKPFECPLCQKTFTQKDNMKIHLNSCSRRDTRIADAKRID